MQITNDAIDRKMFPHICIIVIKVCTGQSTHQHVQMMHKLRDEQSQFGVQLNIVYEFVPCIGAVCATLIDNEQSITRTRVRRAHCQ
jgi:hypothetical protein